MSMHMHILSSQQAGRQVGEPGWRYEVPHWDLGPDIKRIGTMVRDVDVNTLVCSSLPAGVTTFLNPVQTSCLVGQDRSRLAITPPRDQLVSCRVVKGPPISEP